MTKQRLSRSESQEQTRQRILDAALDLFMREGFRATSLEQVAGAAGYTIGAIYSNFANKLAIGIAVVDMLYARVSTSLLEALQTSTEQDPETSLTLIWQALEPELGSPQWARLEMEVTAFGYQTEAFTEAIAARSQRFRQLGQLMILHWCQRAGSAPPADVEARATALVSLMLGLGMQLVMDPSLRIEMLRDALRQVIRALVSPPSA